MNQKISELQLRALCRELMRRGAPVTGRQMRRELQARYGAVGKTARVFRIWRQESRVETAPIMRAQDPAPIARTENSELERRLAAAETEARANRERAELAESRERAHQEHWAMEIDRLREELRAQTQHTAEMLRLREQLQRLRAEVAAYRSGAAPR